MLAPCMTLMTVRPLWAKGPNSVKRQRDRKRIPSSAHGIQLRFTRRNCHAKTLRFVNQSPARVDVSEQTHQTAPVLARSPDSGWLAALPHVGSHDGIKCWTR